MTDADTLRVPDTVVDDGLRQDWRGLVWLNPPYSQAARWLAKAARHPGGCVALLFARTDTSLWQQHVWPCATAMLFLAGRLRFHHADGHRGKENGGAPSVLVGFGAEAAERLARSGLSGALVGTATSLRGQADSEAQR